MKYYKAPIQSSIPEPIPVNSQSPSFSIPSQAIVISAPNINEPTPPPQIQPQPNKLPPYSIYNSQNTSGYFITTDSAFGNQILPVLPRFN